MTRRISLHIALAVGFTACGGGDAAPAADAPAPPAAVATPAVPVSDGPIDSALATRGEQLFQAKACAGCHTIGGGRLTGPDLAGLLERREPAWIVAMIQRPDSMLKQDATARQLLMQYATPMPNLSLTDAEVAALYEYLRRAGS